MKNKATTYFMVAVVAIIWGIVVYKIFFNTDSDATEEILLPVKAMVKDTSKVETYELLADYRDPFLTSAGRPLMRDTAARVKKVEPKPVVQKMVAWPTVGYKGVITSKSKKLGIVIINNAQKLVEPGDSVSQILVLKIFPDSVLLNNGNEIKTFVKK